MPRTGPDAASVLTGYVLLLFLLPARLGVAALGGAGSPATIYGSLCLAWWAYGHVQRSAPTGRRTQPVRLGALAVVLAFLASFVVAMSRAISSEESSTALLGLIGTAALLGPLLLAADGLSDVVDVERLIRRLVLVGGVIAALGIVQFFTGELWVNRISIPGLSSNQALGAVSSRSGFNRPPGTSLHAIEFGVVISMLLPAALNLAITDQTRSVARRWAPPALMGLAAVVSISRSAIVGVILGLLVISLRWTGRQRLTALAVLPVLVLGVFVTIPGILGTLVGLFSGISEDSSASSRTGSYAIAQEFIARSPWLGRGFATFLPTYRIFDNQYLLLLVEVGVVGLLAVVGLILSGIGCASVAAARSGSSALSGQLFQALTAALVVGFVEMGLFDMLNFPQAAGLLFLGVGLAGAAFRSSSRVGEPAVMPAVRRQQD